MKDNLNRRDFGKAVAAAACWGAIATSTPTLFAAQDALITEQDFRWQRVCSSTGALPVPSTSRQQTGSAIGKLDKNSPATDFIMSFRGVGPALVWYRRMPNRQWNRMWDRYVIENEFIPLEAGGTTYDVDGDGNEDIIFGNDYEGNRMWWWENPYPNFDPGVPWKRHIIKDSGAVQHHDIIFADVKGTGKAQLIFWNQNANRTREATLFMADIPKDPRNSGPWNLTPIFVADSYQEGLCAYDVDGDGRLDLLAGQYWFRNLGNGKFKPIKIGNIGGRIRAGKLKPGKYPQIVIASGDGIGPLMMYECADHADPEAPGSWVGHKLLDRDMVHGHSLQLVDMNGDGKLDIVTAEQAAWNSDQGVIYNPKAEAWILYGDGTGKFRTDVLTVGEGWHDAYVADFDGDGDLDLLQTPYTHDAPWVGLWLKNGTGEVPPWVPAMAPSARYKVFNAPVGMELWTYHSELAKDLPGTLGVIHRLGFTDVETASFYGLTAEQFHMLLQRTGGLTCSSLIMSHERLESDLDGIIRDAEMMGASYVVASWIPHGAQFTADDAHKAAANFNIWGGKLKKRGLQFGYHPHGFEFVHTPNATLFDVLATETDPENVIFELDTFWFALGSADPVCYMERYPTRFKLLHLKDMARGTKRNLTGSAPGRDSVTLGQGELNWPAILREAQRIGIQRYYIEDESAQAPRQVLQSVDYLRKLVC